MSQNALLHPAQEGASYWMDHVIKQARSGLSVAAYCRLHGFSQATLYNWRKRSRQSGRVGQARGVVSFTEIPAKTLPGLSEWNLEVSLPGGACMRVAAGADAALVRVVLEALR